MTGSLTAVDTATFILDQLRRILPTVHNTNTKSAKRPHTTMIGKISGAAAKQISGSFPFTSNG